MTRAAPFVFITAAFAAGLWFASQFAPPLWFSALVALIAGAIVIAVRRQYGPLWAAALVALFAQGALRYTLSVPPPSADSPAAYNGRYVVLEGLVIDEPDARPDLAYLRVQVARMAVDSAVVQPRGLVLLRADKRIDWRYGDIVRAYGVLDAPPVFADFDYRDYLARQNVFAWIARPDPLQRIGADQGSPLMSALLRVKADVRRSVQRSMPAPESALLNGILIGDANELPQGIANAFRRTGAAHIVAISGFNVSIVIALIVPLLSRLLGRQLAAGAAIPAVVVYTLFVGASASVQRAAVMAVIMLVGMLIWRRGFTLNTLCAAAFFMLAAEPAMLFDLGFQLSFAATLGLVLYLDHMRDAVQHRIEAHFNRAAAQASAGILADLLFTTLAATLTTLPILLSNFNLLTPSSFLVNPLVLPLQPGAMILGSLAAALGLVSAPLGMLTAWPAYALLTITLRVVEWVGAQPWAAFPVYGFGAPHALAYYAALFGVSAVVAQKPNIRAALRSLVRKRLSAGIVVLIAAIVLALGAVVWFQRPDGKLHVTFSGAGALIQTPSGRQAVFAGGGNIPAVMGRAMPAWDRSIELLVLPQRDDYSRGDSLPILQRYTTGVIVQPDGADEPSAMLDEWNAQAAAQSSRVITLPVDSRITLEAGVVLTVEQRLKGAIGLRLTYGKAAFDLVGNSSVVSGTLDGAKVVFVSVRGAKPALLSAAAPQSVVWADAGGAPPALPPSMRAYALRDLGEVEFVSDGATTWVR
ncbi:MAG: ComEC family competence protein [Chloroflexi bacterium]|nr:ComEC family competence protein [Chloroflexota bacterium]